MASVQDKAKAAALHALRGRNPEVSLGADEKVMIRLIVQSVIDADIARLEQEQQRCDQVAHLARSFLNTSQLSEKARAFLKEEFR